MNSQNKRLSHLPRLQATARIAVVVEVTAGVWGQDCTVDQAYRQAASEALAKVSRLIGREGRVLPDPKVTVVLAEERSHG